MAPTTAKSSRQSFSPPRPRPAKSKVTKVKSAARTKGDGSSRIGGKKRAINVDGKAKTAAKSKATDRERGAAGTMRALFDDEAHDDEHDSDRESEDAPALARGKKTTRPLSEIFEEDSAADEDDDSPPTSGAEDKENDSLPNASDAEEPMPSSPEPDFILAEVTNTTTTTPSYPIPLPLVHHILVQNFTSASTKISTDARSLVGKYVEVFVKEAVARCVAEKKERVQRGEEGDGGWLEVEDLERVGGQLVLDF
jgi:hypothetical protein